MEKVEESEEYEEEKQAETTVAPATTNSDFTKLFQRQISRLKVVSGAPQSKKDHGFLSLERTTSSIVYLVYRNFMGATLFSAVLSPESAKVLGTDMKEGRHQAQVACSSSGKIVVTLNFISKADREQFCEVFAGLSTK